MAKDQNLSFSITLFVIKSFTKNSKPISKQNHSHVYKAKILANHSIKFLNKSSSAHQKSNFDPINLSKNFDNTKNMHPLELFSTVFNHLSNWNEKNQLHFAEIAILNLISFFKFQKEPWTHQSKKERQLAKHQKRNPTSTPTH